MTVLVVHHYDSDRRESFSGNEARVKKDLCYEFPHLLKLGSNATVQDLVQALNKLQAYSAVVKEEELGKSEPRDYPLVHDMLGYSERIDRYLEAAKFLNPNIQGAILGIRERFLEHEVDLEAFALASVALPITESNREALRGVLKLRSEALQKAEFQKPEVVKAMTQSGEIFAQMVRRAIEYDQVDPITLNGKHSKGAMLAHDGYGKDSTGHTLLLKPGSGGQSIAAGARDSGASQAKREAAFSELARDWGLGDYVPEAHLLLIDSHEYAGIEMLSHGFQTLADLAKADLNMPRRLFYMFLDDGTLFKWAVLDYVAGQVDRHAGNLMVRGGEVFLIDAGSAFAGKDFAPASDKYSFVPFYLRAFAPNNFYQLDYDGKFKALPQVSNTICPVLNDWINNLDEEKLKETCYRYGIDAQPEVDRLRKLKNLIEQGMRPDTAINSLWTLP